MIKQSLVMGAAVLLITSGIASAQIAYPPGQTSPASPSQATPPKPNTLQTETSGQNFRDDRLQSDRDSRMVPTPVRPPVGVILPDANQPSTTGQAPLVSPNRPNAVD